MRVSGPITILFCAVALFAGERPQAAAMAAEPKPVVETKSSHALPPLSEVLKSLTASQQEVDAIRKNYVFTMDEDEQAPDGHGNLKTVHHNIYEVHYSGPWVVQTLIVQDGRQLSDAEIKAERQAADKDLRRARSGLIKLESDPNAEGSGGLSISNFLAADKFLNLRHEMFRGREVLVLDFVPNPNFEPKRAVEKLLKNLSGKIWIDEHDLHGIRLEAHVFNNVSYGGFLASVRKGTAIAFEQQKVNGEIWLPSYTELHYDARELFSTKHINLVHRFRDYKKFRVESEVVPF